MVTEILGLRPVVFDHCCCHVDCINDTAQLADVGTEVQGK